MAPASQLCPVAPLLCGHRLIYGLLHRNRHVITFSLYRVYSVAQTNSVSCQKRVVTPIVNLFIIRRVCLTHGKGSGHHVVPRQRLKVFQLPPPRCGLSQVKTLFLKVDVAVFIVVSTTKYAMNNFFSSFDENCSEMLKRCSKITGSVSTNKHCC